MSRKTPLFLDFGRLLTSCRANAEEAALQKQLEPRKQVQDARRLRAAAKRFQRAAGERQNDVFENRPFLERQAALNLAQFAQSNPDLGLGADQVGDLINTLIVSSHKYPPT